MVIVYKKLWKVEAEMWHSIISALYLLSELFAQINILCDKACWVRKLLSLIILLMGMSLQ